MSHVGYGRLMTLDREQVLRSAAALLTRKSTATMDEVARAAGIGRATLHRHFAGRDALVRALEELGIQEFEAALDAAAARRGHRRGRRCGGSSPAIEPGAGLLSFLVTENQLFEGDQVNEGWDRLDARVSALLPARPGAAASSGSTSPPPG